MYQWSIYHFTDTNKGETKTEGRQFSLHVPINSSYDKTVHINEQYTIGHYISTPRIDYR